jgi:hypothetical protein
LENYGNLIKIKTIQEINKKRIRVAAEIGAQPDLQTHNSGKPTCGNKSASTPLYCHTSAVPRDVMRNKSGYAEKEIRAAGS